MDGSTRTKIARMKLTGSKTDCKGFGSAHLPMRTTFAETSKIATKLNEMNKPHYLRKSIRGIDLEGFQVFDKPINIPFGRITLAFGPNSAGKSSIQDALSIFQELFIGEKTKSRTDRLQTQLCRHWRRSGNGIDDYVPRMSIAVNHSFIPDLDSTGDEFGRMSFAEDYPEQSSWFAQEHEFKSKAIFTRRIESKPNDLKYTIDYELYEGNELLLARTGSGIRVNLKHPYFIFSKLGDEFLQLSLIHPGKIKFDGNYLDIPEGVYGFSLGSTDIESCRESYFFQDRKTFQSNDGNSDKTLGDFIEASNLLKESFAELGFMVNMIVHVVNGRRPYWFERVDASRTIPTRKELTFEYISVDGRLRPLEKDRPSGFENSSDLNYLWLAAAITEDLQRIVSRKAKSSRMNNDILTRINETLSENLFIEQGYRLDYSFRVRLSEANSLAAVEAKPLDASEFEFEVEIFLRSETSGKHYFEDVGSGIGYVLPVLCTLSAGLRDFVTIQQPELHLHPALQAAMGDVFIESMSNGAQSVVETHSEHLLLRVLRRVRETHNNRAVSKELEIEADDVCVLYFNPSIEGVTAVKRIRISRDGKFLDRWPRGFFAERSVELFDE